MTRNILFTIVFITFLFVGQEAIAQSKIGLIPYPDSLEAIDGVADFSSGFNFVGDKILKDYGQKELTKFLHSRPDKRGLKIDLQLSKDFSGSNEAYLLTIEPKQVTIRANAVNGLFYGIQSLKQLGLQYGTQVPCLRIIDQPRFAWRAYMLDEGRYFQGKKAVMKLLDEMALLKLNTFHWHLTDDAGWRIEIKKYPQLTKIGSERDSSQTNDQGKKWDSKTSDRKKHAGYYSQAEIREIVAYAKDRNIQVIPEISMPGHASAAVASYPWLGASKKPIKVPTKFGVVSTVFDVSDPKVIQFLKDVLTEVAGLFPASVMHIGGDEVKYDQWAASEQVSRYMKDHKLKTHSDLQVYFTNEMSNFVQNSLQKRMMGWNEILGMKIHAWQKNENAEMALSQNTIVHFWQGEIKGINYASEKGYQIVNSLHGYTYLDYTYGDIGLEKAYSFDPIPADLKPEFKKNIIGLGCQMWGEWTPTMKEVEYQTFPRIAAYAETGWSKQKDYPRFLEQLKYLYQLWSGKGYNLPKADLFWGHETWGLN